MATLLSQTSGNFTNSSTWGLVDPTSYLNSEAATSNTTTTFTNTSQFTPGAITIDGIAVKVNSHTLVGTFSIRLVTGGGAAGTTTGTLVTGTDVTIDAADLPTVNTSIQNGWTYLKFAAPVTLLAATAYNLQYRGSTASNVNLFRDGTASNLSRALKTTTNQAPAAGDELLISGEYTASGVNTTYTVTMDNTNTTIFGQMQIGGKGILSYGTASSTNYHFKTSGNLRLYTGSTFEIGTSGTPIPSSSTAKLEFSNTVNVDFGVEAGIGSSFTTFGSAIINSALLAADASATATSLTTNVSTNWKTGDVIAIASTTRTRTEAESKSLTANAVGTTLTISALTNAHSGTSPIQAELINLTRNVQIFGTSSTLQSYLNLASSAIININNTEFYFLGSNTGSKRGIDIATTIGSCIIDGCSMHDFIVTGSIGTNINATANNNVTFSNNVMYAIASTGLVLAGSTAGTANVLNNIIVIAAGQAASATGITISDLRGSLTNLTGTSCQGTGISIADNTATAANIFGTINNLTAHSNSSNGISLTNITGVTNNPMGLFQNLVSWRNNANGITASNSFTIMIDTVNVFGNATSNINIGSTECDNIYFKSVTANAGSVLTCPIGVNITSDCHEIYFDTSTFGITTQHSTGDVNVSSTNFFPRIILRDCLLNSTTPVANSTKMTEGGFIRLAKFQQTNGNHKTFYKYGTITSDTIIYNSGPVSARLTPNNALSNDKLQGSIKKIAVPSGQTATIKVFLRKSVIGDGSAYNGSQPRLMLKMDPAAGVTSDTVLATADNTYDGVFKALTATTPVITDNAVFQVYIDCDGTAGWVNEDDWSIS